MTVIQWRIKDFPDGGGANLKLFWHFSEKTACKLKINIDPGAGMGGWMAVRSTKGYSKT